MDYLEVSLQETKALLDSNANLPLLDVCEDFERQACAILPSLHIPLGELESRIAELDKGIPIIIYCHHGRRSLLAARILCARGFSAKSKAEGTQGWSQKIDSALPKH